jgi:hypothetical protein
MREHFSSPRVLQWWYLPHPSQPVLSMQQTRRPWHCHKRKSSLRLIIVTGVIGAIAVGAGTKADSTTQDDSMKVPPIGETGMEFIRTAAAAVPAGRRNSRDRFWDRQLFKSGFIDGRVG